MDVRQVINDALDEHYAEARKEGIADGVRVSGMILAWFLANPTLKEPYPLETLERWSREAIEKLREELTDAE